MGGVRECVAQLPGEPLKETPFEGSTKDYQFNVAREFIDNAMKDDRKPSTQPEMSKAAKWRPAPRIHGISSARQGKVS